MSGRPGIAFSSAPARGGFAITAGGRAATTPAGRPFVVPTEQLAQAIAAELGTHGIEASSATRLRRMAVAAIEDDSDGAGEAIAGTAAYAATDLLCYRADAPADLARRQAEAWQPLLDWATDTYGAHLAVTAGVAPLDQDGRELAKLAAALSACGRWRRAAVRAAAVACGSLILALALAGGRVDAAQAWRLSRLDHDFQAERWGADEEALAAAAEVRADLDAAARFLRLIDG